MRRVPMFSHGLKPQTTRHTCGEQTGCDLREVTATTKRRNEYHRKFQKSDTDVFTDPNDGSIRTSVPGQFVWNLRWAKRETVGHASLYLRIMFPLLSVHQPRPVKWALGLTATALTDSVLSWATEPSSKSWSFGYSATSSRENQLGC
jgi:hypothetical protein